MKIWLISIFEQTPVDNVFSTRFVGIADAALKRNHQVKFFASTFKHNTKNQRYKKTTCVSISDAYQLFFIKSIGYKNNLSAKRLYSHYAYSRQLLIQIKKMEKPDVIFMAFPSISIAFQVTQWAKTNDIPVILDIIDPWPENFKKPLRWLPGRIIDILLSSLNKKTRSVFKDATAITAISKQYIEWARKYNPFIKKTGCFYPAVDFKEMQQQLIEAGKGIEKDESKFRVIYAGSLASSYDIPTILKAAKILEAKYPDKTEFIIAGTGPHSVAVEQYANENNNLKYTGRLVKKDLMKEYFKADVGLTQHIKGASQSVTYKLFDLLSCGLPIMNSLESEMKDIILDNQVGLFNPPGDAEKLAENIAYCFLNKREFLTMRKNALDLTARLGNSSIVYGGAIDFIEEVVSAYKKRI